VLSPVLGRFVQKDKIDYVGERNPYLFVQSRPVIQVDWSGLWKCNRKGGLKAPCVAEEGDTLSTLAEQVGLNPVEWRKWATIEGKVKTEENSKTEQELTSRTKIAPGQVVHVPNTIVAYWAGELGLFGMWWVSWDEEVRYLEERGFYVGQPQPLTASRFQNLMRSFSEAKILHGLYFWGHGFRYTVSQGQERWNPGIMTLKESNVGSPYSNWNLDYELGFGLMYCCYGRFGRRYFSRNAEFWGKYGVLNPVFGEYLVPFHGHIPSVSEILLPGEQGTN